MFFAWGNQPITSTQTPVAAPSTSSLIAELDSTVLGTAFLVGDRSLNVRVTWVLGADTNVTWQCGACTSTALNAGADEFFPKTPTAQSGQYITGHVLKKDYRLRARLASTGANAAAYISAEVVL